MSHHIASALRFVCACVANVWRSTHVYGTGTCVWYAHVCVALVHACMCMQDMIRTHVKMKCKEKNGTFEVYYLPAIVCHSYVLVYNLHITYVSVCTRMLPICSCMYSYVVVCTHRLLNYVFICYSYVLMLLICTRMLLICTHVVF